MDARRFDLLTRFLATRINRRWIGAAVLLSVAPAPSRAEGPDTEMIPPPCRRVRQQCASAAECCSGRCVAKADGTSRCGRKHGRNHGHAERRDRSTCGDRLSPCSVDADCCTALICNAQSHICEPPPAIPLGDPCTPDDTCAEGSCQPYTESTAIWMSPYDPTATFCLLDLGAVCEVNLNVHPGWTADAWNGCRGTQCWGSVCGNKTIVGACENTMDTCQSAAHDVWSSYFNGGICTTDVNGNPNQIAMFSNTPCQTASDCPPNFGRERCVPIQQWSQCMIGNESSGNYCAVVYLVS